MRKEKNTKKIRVIAALCLAVLLLSALAVAVFADDGAQTHMENVLTYDGLSARVKEYGGIRSVYLVDQEAVKALEDSGYSVAYGAVMGIGNYKGSVINTTRSLAVKGDFQNGYVAANGNASAVVVYATGAPAYVTGRHLDETNTSFAYTTTYASANAEKYGIELVYAGFVAVTDREGNETVIYDYAEGDLFGSETSLYGSATSALELSRYFVNDYNKSALKAYHYNQSSALRCVLSACGESIRELKAPLTLTEITETVALQKSVPASYFADAKTAYKTAAYADYTTSVVGNYATSSGAYNDRPMPVTLSWTASGDETLQYTVTLATDADFTQNVRTVETMSASVSVYNLLVGSTYYWKVQAVTEDGYAYETPVSTFETENTVRWIYADGVRNVRDIGGWTGLNQGLVYRGSELNLVGSHGLQITESGIDMVVGTLGVKTDLDFRAASENGDYGTSSPLGEGVTYKNRAIGNFLSAFSSSYANVLKLFANPDNYPFYMHCWGGADRTGTVALMLEGICGVAEEDLAIDLELTSFAIFGYRYRYDNGAYLYASTIQKIKNDFEGDTLQEKFENYALSIGMTRAEISNIQSILSGTGAAFASDSLATLVFSGNADEIVTLSLHTPSGQTVQSVSVDGVSIPFSYENGNLTILGSDLIASGVVGGEVVLQMSDGQTLRTEMAEALWSQIAGGDYTKLFNEGTVKADGNWIVKEKGEVSFTYEALRSLYEAGYTSVSFRVNVDFTGPVSASDARIRLIARWAKNGGSDYLSGDKQDITASTYPSTGTAFITIHLTEEYLGEGNCFKLVPQTGENIVLKNFVLSKNGEKPTESSNVVDEIEHGNYAPLFRTNLTETNGVFAGGGKIRFSHDALLALYNAGYTSISFRVTSSGMTGTQRVVIRWCTSLTSDSYLSGGTKYDVYANADDNPSDATVADKFITIVLNETVLADINFIQLAAQSASAISLKNIVLCKAGETPVEPSAPEVEEPDEGETESEADAIVGGDYAKLYQSTVTVENGAIVTENIAHFSHGALVALYEAGYTTISFHVRAELTSSASASDSRVRLVARWTSGGSSYISNSDKQDIDLGGKLGVAEKTLTFHLTEEFLGEGNYIRLHAQTGDAIVFSDFSFGK